MRKEKISTYQYTLTEDEFKCFTRALVYIRHRILKHNSKGALTVGSFKYIIDMLNNIEKI